MTHPLSTPTQQSASGAPVPPPALLECIGIDLRFGGVSALSEVDVAVKPDELVAIIGPNGAGKTSFLNVVSGFYRPQSGRIDFAGQRMDRLSCHRVARLGVARTFQGTHLFSGMTVLDNILAGRHLHMATNVLQAFLQFHWCWREEIAERERAPSRARTSSAA